jgi:hypothetical protein
MITEAVMRTLFAAALLATLSVAPAAAISLVNRDAEPRVVTIMPAAGSTEPEAVVTLAPSEARSDLCREGCEISLDTGEIAEFDGDEDVAIEEGRLTVAQ